MKQESIRFFFDGQPGPVYVTVCVFNIVLQASLSVQSLVFMRACPNLLIIWKIGQTDFSDIFLKISHFSQHPLISLYSADAFFSEQRWVIWIWFVRVFGLLDWFLMNFMAFIFNQLYISAKRSFIFFLHFYIMWRVEEIIMLFGKIFEEPAMATFII